MARQGEDYCFACGSYAVSVLSSRPGGRFFPWRRRRRGCRQCGVRWNTIEVIDPADPLAPSRVAAREEGEAVVPPLLSDPVTEALAWQDVRTWELR